MTAILVILLLMSWFAFYLWVKNRRAIIINDLRTLYSKIETAVIQEKVKPDNKLLNLLKGYKNIITNPELADIQVLWSIASIVPSHRKQVWKKNHEKFLGTLPEKLVNLDKEFDNKVTVLVNLSIVKPDFVLFAFKVFIRLVWKIGLRKITNLPSQYRELVKNDVVYVNQSARFVHVAA